jgi:hypothetical protein
MILSNKNQNIAIMEKVKLFAVVFVVLAFAIVSCQKGATGPAGANGATGATGPAGPDSVIHSAWITLNMTLQSVDSLGDSIFDESIAASQITQRILDSGLVLIYFQNADGSIVDVADYAAFLNVSCSLGSIDITSFGQDINGYEVRYVIVPGSLYATNSFFKGYTKQQLKAIDYNTISKVLGISNNAKSD